MAQFEAMVKEENEEDRPRIVPQNWPRPQPQLRPPPPQQYSGQEVGEAARRSVSFGPPVRAGFPEPRVPQQSGVLRRPSPWAVLRAKLPTPGEPVRPFSEHLIQRMQNPSPQMRPPMPRPPSQEGMRQQFMPRADSFGARPPSSPRPGASPVRMTGRPEDEEGQANDSRVQTPVSRPPSGQKSPMPSQQGMPLQGMPPAMRTPPSGTPPVQQTTNPFQQVQNQNQRPPTPQQHVTTNQLPSPQTSFQTSQPQPNQTPLIQTTTSNPSSVSHTSFPHSPQPTQNHPSQPTTVTPPLNQSQTIIQNQAQNSTQSTPSSSGHQTPTPASPGPPNSTQSSVPPSPNVARKLSSSNTLSTASPTPTPSPAKSPSIPPKQSSLQDDTSTPKVKSPEKQKTPDKTLINSNAINKDIKDNKPKTNEPAKEPVRQPPVVVDATPKRPKDLKPSTANGKAEEIDKTAKENEPPKPENSKSENQSSKEPVLNGKHESPKKSAKAAPPKKLGTAQSPLKSPNKPHPKTPETPGTAEKKKLPMNKVQVGAAPSPNLKSVRSKIGSLENANHKPGGGNIKIEHRKLNFNVAPKIEAKNDTYQPGGGDKKIQQVKLQWNAKSKIGSLENATHKPGGGDKKIESVKLDFKEKAKPKVGSKDNMKHQAGGGNVKNSEESQGKEGEIEEHKLEIKAESKIGSLDNVKHKPGGGEKKIFDDKEYLKQMASTSHDSLNQERKKRSRCNSTSSQESRYRSQELIDKTGSRTSLLSREHTREKSMSRPTDQNSNQVNDKNSGKESGKPKGEVETQIKTNGVNYEESRKDANGNGKSQGRMEHIEESPKSVRAERPTAVSDISQREINAKLPPVPPMKSPGQPSSQPKSPNSVQNLPRPQMTPQSPNSPNVPGMPPNVRMAKDLINETFKNDGIVEKSLTERPEKEVKRSPEAK